MARRATTRDANGAPRGWGESLAPGAPAAGLLVAALITLPLAALAAARLDGASGNARRPGLSPESAGSPVAG